MILYHTSDRIIKAPDVHIGRYSSYLAWGKCSER